MMRLSMKPSLNWFFVFVPVSVLLEHLEGVPIPLIFFSAALAILPIASIIVKATEQIALRVGDTIGGLLNATFGNAPELIITIVALRAGLFDMVRASLAGAILANLLLALGVAFLLGGIRYHEQQYNPVASRTYATMMLIAVISLSIPSGLRRVLGGNEPMVYEQSLNLCVALALLLAYLLSLLFMLKTHPDLFRSIGNAEQNHHAEGHRWSVGRAVITLVAGSVLAAWMSEILVGAAEGTGKSLGMSETFIGIIFLAIVGGAAESGSAIATARRNKVDLSIGIALGSCVQIALFIAPILVLASYIVSPQPFLLAFSRIEILSIFLAILVGVIVAGDGRSHWFKGVQLITLYLVMAMMFYFLPTAH
jgi:Ca2+:H+ antiporter